MPKILIIDDEPAILNLLASLSRRLGHQFVTAENATAGLDEVRRQKPDLLIVDLRIGDVSGIEVMRQARELHPSIQVIMITGYGTVDSAVEAMRLGAFDYVTKPFDVHDLESVIQRALEQEKAATPLQPSPVSSMVSLVGRSEGFQKLSKQVEKVVDNPGAVLLSGEFGVGKQTIARYIHRSGKRKSLPMKILPCSALSEELLEHELMGNNSIFQRALGGTVLMEDIHALPLRLQAHLVMFLEDPHQANNFRLMVSTTTSLEELSKDGKFRRDLYYRLSPIHLVIPPLRERRDDIPDFAVLFLEEIASRTGTKPKPVSRYALDFLMRHHWAGNLDELRHSLEHACVFNSEGKIEPDDLPKKITAGSEVFDPDNKATLLKLPIGSSLADFSRTQEQMFIMETIKFSGGSKEKAASILGVSIATLYRKLEM